MKVINYSFVTFTYIDHTTGGEAICSDWESVEAVVCDTDKLCLLHHQIILLDFGKNIFMSSMKLIGSSEQHFTCRIQDGVEKKSMKSNSCLLMHFAGVIQNPY